MSTSLTVSIKQLDKGLELPHQAYPGDCAVDLRSTIDIDVQPQERAMIPTGIAIELPRGYAGLVIPRSGLAARHGITIVNAPGLVDSDYRGEISVVLLNTDVNDVFHISRGDRIAQLMITTATQVEFTVVDELNDSTRGAQGFGSSGC